MTEAALALFAENDPVLLQYVQEHLLVTKVDTDGQRAVVLHHGNSRVEVSLGLMPNNEKKKARKLAIKAALVEIGYNFDNYSEEQSPQPRTVVTYEKYNLFLPDTREQWARKIAYRLVGRRPILPIWG